MRPRELTVRMTGLTEASYWKYLALHVRVLPLETPLQPANSTATKTFELLKYRARSARTRNGA